MVLLNLQRVLLGCAALVLTPVANHPAIALSVISLVAGVILLWAFSKVSNQVGLKATKQKLQAALLESILFRQTPSVSLRAQASMLVLTARYLSFTLPPLLILLLPCVLLLSAIRPWVGLEPLKQGAPTIITATVANESELDSVEATSGHNVHLSAPVREPSERSASWRVTAVDGAPSAVTIRVGKDQQSVELPLSVIPLSVKSGALESGTNTRGIVDRVGQGVVDALLYPSRLALPGDLTRVEIRYPDAHYAVGSFEIHWLLLFFVLSMISGLVASRYLKISV